MYLNATRSDVPAWLEVMDRTKRTKQLVYAVRVKETITTQKAASEPQLLAISDWSGAAAPEAVEKEKKSNVVTTSRTFIKLRTGRELAPIIQRLGVEFRPFDQQR